MVRWLVVDICRARPTNANLVEAIQFFYFLPADYATDWGVLGKAVWRSS